MGSSETGVCSVAFIPHDLTLVLFQTLNCGANTLSTAFDENVNPSGPLTPLPQFHLCTILAVASRLGHVAPQLFGSSEAAKLQPNAFNPRRRSPSDSRQRTRCS